MYGPFDLTGKVALVTGGNGGMGLGMADGLARAGADIVIWGTNEAKSAVAEETLKAHGVRVLAQRVDITDEHAVNAAMTDAVAKMGRVDSVIANAGAHEEGAFISYSTESYRRLVAVNLDGVFFTLRAACSHMVDRARKGDPGGSLVAISSVSAVHGAARNEIYGATKGALISLIKAVAVEHARYGVRANAILPGWVATEMMAANQENEKFVTNVIGRVPMRRWAKPDDFSGMAVYLCSDASSFHTGDSIRIDGGYAIF